MRKGYFIKILLCVLLNSAFTGAIAQYVSIDSLRKIINTTKDDRARIDALNWTSYRLYQQGAIDSSVFFAKQALSLSEKINYQKGKGVAYINFGAVSMYEYKFSVSFQNIRKAVNLLELAGDKAFTGIAYSNLGLLYCMEGNYPAGLQHVYKALKLQKESGYKFGLAHCYFVLGFYYQFQKNFEEADENIEKALELYQILGEKHLLSICLIFKGDNDTELGKYYEALKSYAAAKNIYNDMGNPEWTHAVYYGSVANVYEKQSDSALLFHNKRLAKEKYIAAEQNFLLAIKYVEADDSLSLSFLYCGIGRLYCKYGNIPESKKYLTESIRLAKPFNKKDILKNAYLYLSLADSISGYFKESYNNYKMHIVYRDSLFNEETVKITDGYKMQYESEKKEDQIKLLSSENELKKALATKHRQQKDFAYIGIATILLAGGYGFNRYRRRKRLQSQQAVLNERLRISSELHDEVGATLSGIAMYSHLTREQIKTGQMDEIEKSLHVMQQSSTQMVDKLSDIVWLINPEQDSLEKLVTRLEEYATDMAAIKNMQVKISVPEKIAEINLPVESRRNIYLFCKEAINNAVKYSHATLLELTVKEVDSKLEFSVTDNGKGFDAVMVRRGNGLENMQKRADEIGAKLILQSKENEGASVSLQCKIT